MDTSAVRTLIGDSLSIKKHTLRPKVHGADVKLGASANTKQMPNFEEKRATLNGMIFPPDNAPGIISPSDVTFLNGRAFVVGCVATGAPAICCVQTGQVWVGSFLALIECAVREGLGEA